jgi:hypothetical protein
VVHVRISPTLCVSSTVPVWRSPQSGQTGCEGYVRCPFGHS